MGVGHFSGGELNFMSPEEAEEEMFRPRCVDGEREKGVWVG